MIEEEKEKKILILDDEQVVLETADGHSLIADDEQSLLYDQVGWDLPLGDLRQWILGIAPSNGLHKVIFDDQGNINQLEYQNWIVKYLSYQHLHGYWVPRKMHITSEKIKLRIVIDQWQLES